MGRRRSRRTTKSNVRDLSRAPLLSRRDWVYSLSLLIPFVSYNFILKALDIASQPGGPGLGGTLESMRSNIFFNLGYVLLWIGLFAAVRGRESLRQVVVVLFHVMTMLLVIVTTCAHYYFQQTGTTLDYVTLAEWVRKLDEIQPSLFQEGSLLSVRAVLFAALFYAAFGPRFVTRAVGWWRGWSGRRSPTVTPSKISFFGSLGLCLLAFGFGWLSLLSGTDTLAREPIVNLALTGLEETSTEEDDPDAGLMTTERSATDTEEVPTEEDVPDAGSSDNLSAVNAGLAQTPQTERRNVVLVHLESTRAQSATPYNEDLKTMPFLNELAKSSLLAERAHVVVPRSSKGSVAINCGIEPALYPGPEYEPGGIPAKCLVELLREQGYSTVFFQSTANSADDFGAVVKNFGYEEFYPSETMNTEGYQWTNTFGYEEDIMLGPSEEWLKERRADEPFLAEYFTGTGHYGYECVPNRYGYERFSEDEQLDRYHNCLRMLDFFLQNLFDQYKELGLYEETIFVLYGDHGEGFFEHGRYMHGDNIYEEGLHVPLIVHDPKRFQDGERVEGLSSQIDVLPTVLDLLGYEVEGGEYPGYSLLDPLPEERILRSSCVSPYRCMASIKGYEKYIHHYGDQPDEFFNLYEDPLEKRNLAGERSKEELDERREDLFAWRRRIDAEHGSIQANGTRTLYSEKSS